MRTVILAKNAPTPVGPYNQAVSAQGFVFTAGQIPIDPSTNEMVPGGITEQTERVLANLKAILEAAGSSFEKVVKATVFLKDLNDFASMNAVYGKYFRNENAPARSTVQVARLPKDALVEIETIALAA